MNDQWEYKTVDYKQTSFFSGAVKVEPLEIQLNELGRMGWELVSAVPNHQINVAKGLVLVLKRKR
jgi:hypothetical protein